MKHIKKNLRQALLWLMLGLVPQLACAEVPNVINYQGYLTDSSGSPLKGTVNVTLTFWDALTGGNTLGAPKSYPNAEVNNGVLSQNVDVSDITFDNPVYVETTVNGETLAPRQLVTSVPFAYRANTAANADKLDGRDSSEFVTSETDPTVPANLKDGVSWSEVANRPAGLDDGDDVGITSETDPTVPANLKDGVSWSEVSNRPAGLDDIEKLEKRLAELETENQRLQELTSPTVYVKTLMKAKYGNGEHQIFVTGPVGKTCSEICDSIISPSVACGGRENTPMTGSCLALWCKGQFASRKMAPYVDPWFNYGCNVTTRFLRNLK